MHPALSDEWMRYLESCFAPYEEAYQRDKLRWSEGPFKPLRSAAEELTTSLRQNVDWFDNHLPATPNAIVPVVPTAGRHIVYTMSSEVVRIADDYKDAVRDLPQGVYIVDNSKVIVP